MARREVGRKPRRRGPDPTLGFDPTGRAGVGHDVPGADSSATSGPAKKHELKPSAPLDSSLPIGPLTNRVKAETQEKIKDITGRLTQVKIFDFLVLQPNSLV